MGTDRVTGAILIALSLFLLWALNTGRLSAIGDIITKGPNAATPSLTGGKALVGNKSSNPCHSILSASCAGTITDAVSHPTNIIKDIGKVFGL